MRKLVISIAAIAALSAAAIAQDSEKFGGLGISIWAGKSGASVASVLPNSPAAQAGLQAGDMIISVNGTALSSVAPEKQISLLRGGAGSSVNLLVQRNGKSVKLSSKRASISVQNLEAQEVSAWFGKNRNVTLEELNYLASQKVGDGYELMGVMQKGFLVDSDIERLNAQQMQHISLKKETAKEDSQIGQVNAPSISKAGALNSANRGSISFSLAEAAKAARISVFNAKGVVVWQRNLGELPAGDSNIDWNGTSLPLGSYHARLEANGMVLTQKFELR